MSEYTKTYPWERPMEKATIVSCDGSLPASQIVASLPQSLKGRAEYTPIDVAWDSRVPLSGLGLSLMVNELNEVGYPTTVVLHPGKTAIEAACALAFAYGYRQDRPFVFTASPSPRDSLERSIQTMSMAVHAALDAKLNGIYATMMLLGDGKLASAVRSYRVPGSGSFETFPGEELATVDLDKGGIFNARARRIYQNRTIGNYDFFSSYDWEGVSYVQADEQSMLPTKLMEEIKNHRTRAIIFGNESGVGIPQQFVPIVDQAQDEGIYTLYLGPQRVARSFLGGSNLPLPEGTINISGMTTPCASIKAAWALKNPPHPNNGREFRHLMSLPVGLGELPERG